MQCTRCGHENRDGERYCSYCGERLMVSSQSWDGQSSLVFKVAGELDSGDDVRESPGTSYGSGTSDDDARYRENGDKMIVSSLGANAGSYCKNCGTFVKDGMKFCPNCGAAMVGESGIGNPSTGYGERAYGNPSNTTAPTINVYVDRSSGEAAAPAGYKSMSFGEAIKSVFSKYATFEGRARRSEYWFFFLFNVLISMGFGFIPFLGLILTGIWVLVTFLPTLALSVRRLHDTGKSGVYYLMILIPLAGPIIMLVFFCTDSEPGDNYYGSNPKLAY